MCRFNDIHHTSGHESCLFDEGTLLSCSKEDRGEKLVLDEDEGEDEEMENGEEWIVVCRCVECLREKGGEDSDEDGTEDASENASSEASPPTTTTTSPPPLHPSKRTISALYLSMLKAGPTIPRESPAYLSRGTYERQLPPSYLSKFREYNHAQLRPHTHTVIRPYNSHVHSGYASRAGYGYGYGYASRPRLPYAYIPVPHTASAAVIPPPPPKVFFMKRLLVSLPASSTPSSSDTESICTNLSEDKGMRAREEVRVKVVVRHVEWECGFCGPECYCWGIEG